MNLSLVLRSKLFPANAALRVPSLNFLGFFFSFNFSGLGFLRLAELLQDKVDIVAWLMLMILLYYFEADSLVESQ
jgi:cytochrome c biogenesis protein CcdA